MRPVQDPAHLLLERRVHAHPPHRVAFSPSLCATENTAYPRTLHPQRTSMGLSFRGGATITYTYERTFTPGCRTSHLYKGNRMNHGTGYTDSDYGRVSIAYSSLSPVLILTSQCDPTTPGLRPIILSITTSIAHPFIIFHIGTHSTEPVATIRVCCFLFTLSVSAIVRLAAFDSRYSRALASPATAETTDHRPPRLSEHR